jgi:hypothetical protein
MLILSILLHVRKVSSRPPTPMFGILPTLWREFTLPALPVLLLSSSLQHSPISGQNVLRSGLRANPNTSKFTRNSPPLQKYRKAQMFWGVSGGRSQWLALSDSPGTWWLDRYNLFHHPLSQKRARTTGTRAFGAIWSARY